MDQGMYCSSCGTKVEPQGRFCPNCGLSIESSAESTSATVAGRSSGAELGQRPEIPNYLPQAILVTIFCCLPFGIVSIVYAAQVNGKVAAGDIDGARDASEKAKTWAWVALGFGLLPVAIVSFGICGIFI